MTWHVSRSYRMKLPTSQATRNANGQTMYRSEEYAELHAFARYEDAMEFSRRTAATAAEWAPRGAYDIHVSEPIRDRNRSSAA